MLITFMSDLGSSNPYLPWMESHVRHAFTNAQFLTISNDIKAFSIIDAAYLWKCTLNKYPQDTFHISLFDTILSFPQQILVKENNGNYYIGIDNGLITTTFDYTENPEQKIYATKKVCANFQEYINEIINIIDILSDSGINEIDFYDYHPNIIYQFPHSIIHPEKIDCKILFIDKHDNIVTDLTTEVYNTYLLGKNFKIRLHKNETISSITEKPCYDNKAELMAYFNEFGFLQISVSSKKYKTASLLGFHSYRKDSPINSYISIEISQ